MKSSTQAFLIVVSLTSVIGNGSVLAGKITHLEKGWIVVDGHDLWRCSGVADPSCERATGLPTTGQITHLSAEESRQAWVVHTEIAYTTLYVCKKPGSPRPFCITKKTFSHLESKE